VAELADAPDLGSGAFGVGVRVPSPAPLQLYMIQCLSCGSSSVVEYNLAKVGVAGSNPVFRFYDAGVAELADAQDLKSCGR
jgi:hypothetical protein